MSRVIANERLVVREKLSALYQDKLTDATARTDALLKSRLASLDAIAPAANPYPLFRQLVLENNIQGVVIWDKDGSLVYPQATLGPGNTVSSSSPLTEAWQQEFAKKD